MGLFDENIQVTISRDPVAAAPKGFGLLLIAFSDLLAGFTERVRYYSNSADANADADLSAGAKAAVAAVFAQDTVPEKVGIGRLGTLGGASFNFTFAPGATGNIFGLTFTINGVAQTAITHTQGGADTPTVIANAFKSLLDASPFAAQITTTVADGSLTVAFNDWDDVASVVADNGADGGVITTVQTAAVTMAAELDAIKAANDDWFGLCLATRSDEDAQYAAALWANTNGKLCVIQSGAAAIKNAAYDSGNPTANIFARIVAAELPCGLVFHETAADWMDVARTSQKLAVNLDEKQTFWAYTPIKGSSGIQTLTATEYTNIKTYNAEVYNSIKGIAVLGMGRMANGFRYDEYTTDEWSKARIEEAVATLLTAASATNNKVPYTMTGFVRMGAVIRKHFRQGELAGHYVEGSGQLTLLDVADLAQSDKDARRYPMTYSVAPAGAVEGTRIGGTITAEV